jgi:hypothetical protein
LSASAPGLSSAAVRQEHRRVNDAYRHNGDKPT